MQGTTGIVSAVDRTTHRCRVQALGSASGAQLSLPAKRPILYPKYRGDPPPPLSYVDLEQIQPGVWRVSGIGPVADRRNILRDDFSLVVRNGTGTVWGDTIWAESGAGTVTQSNAAGGIGVADFDTVTTGVALTKGDQSVVLDATLGYWLSCSIALGARTSVFNGAGFSNLAGTTQALVGYSDAAFIVQLTTVSGGVTTVVDLGSFTPTNNVFFTVDLLLVPGVFAAAWLDGQGPYVSTTNIPAVGAMVQPYIIQNSVPASSKHLYVDWIRVEAFSPVANPLRDLIVPASGIVA